MAEYGYEIEIRGVTKRFEKRDGSFLALDEVNLEIAKNEFICVVGPSGCGKTTLLNIIAGLYPPSTGTVRVRGELVTGPGKGKGVVFQQYALYPWLTVEKNVEFGMKMKGVKKSERKAVSEKYIRTVGLEKFAKSYPKELSGGMKQRVAIARAYATDPEVLLMDEPFGALDAQTRYAMEEEILRIWNTEKRTVIFVTNNIEEAVTLGDRVVQFTERPARVKKVYDLSGLGRPRSHVSEEFLRVRQEIAANEELTLE